MAGPYEHVFQLSGRDPANCMRNGSGKEGMSFCSRPRTIILDTGFTSSVPEHALLPGARAREWIRGHPHGGASIKDNVGIRGPFFGIRYYFSMAGPWYAVSDPAKIEQARAADPSHDCVIPDDPLAKDFDRPHHLQPDPSTERLPSPGGKDQKGDNLVSSPKKKHPMLAGLERWFTNSYYSEAGTRLAWLLNPFRLRRFRRKNSFQNRSCYQRMDD